MLPPSARCLLLLLSLALVSRCHAVITQLPALSVYAGLGDFSSASSSTAGAIAVYGNANISNYAIGDLLPPAPAGTRDSVVVQGTSTLLNVNVAGGNYVACGAVAQTDLSVNGGSLLSACARVDFPSTNLFLTEFANTFSALPATGAPTRVNQQFTFTASPGVAVNIYNVPAPLFQSIQFLNIVAPSGVYVVINVAGTNNTFQDFQTMLSGGINASSVTYNFPNTTTLTVQAISVIGTLVAPLANVTFDNGFVNGSIFAGSFTGTGGVGYELPLTPPCPVVPCPPCPTMAPLPSVTAFAFNTLIAQQSADAGNLACGGDMKLIQFSVGNQTAMNGTCPSAIITGGALSFNSGNVAGDVYTGTTAAFNDVSIVSPCVVKQNTGRNAILNFDAVQANVLAISGAYGQWPATDPTQRMFNQVTLLASATSSGVSVFSFPSSLLAGCTDLTIIAPSPQLVIINVPGTNNTIANFQIVLQGGVDASHVLWNFYESTVLNIGNVMLVGTVFAPTANVTFPSGEIQGALFAQNIIASGDFAPAPPIVPICPVCPPNPCNKTMV